MATAGKGRTDVYRWSEYKTDLRPRVKIEIVVTDSDMDPIVTVIAEAGRTGKMGDGKIFVPSIEDAIRIRNSEHGNSVL